MATAVLVAWAVWRGRGWPLLAPRQWLGLAAAGVIGGAGYALFFMFTLRRVEASRAAVVVTTNPVFTTLLAAWLFKERFNARIALGMACGLAGAVTVLTHGAPWALLGGGIGVGEWLLLGCIATWVGYTLIARALPAGIDSLQATAISAVFGTALLWIAALTLDGAQLAGVSLATLCAAGWFALIFLAVGSTGLACVWYFRGVAELGAGTAASCISLVPVFGVGSAALVLGERVDASLLIGGALAVAGVVLMNRARRSPAQPTE